MGEANGEGIGLIGAWVVAEAEEGTGHKGDLFFAGGASTGGGFFNQLGRIFVDGEAPACGGEKGNAPGGSEDDGGAGVLDVDDQLDGEFLRGVACDEFLQAVMDFEEAGWGGAGGGVSNGTGVHDNGFFCGAFENGVAGGSEGGVEGEDAHAASVPSRGKLSREPRGA